MSTTTTAMPAQTAAVSRIQAPQQQHHQHQPAIIYDAPLDTAMTTSSPLFCSNSNNLAQDQETLEALRDVIQALKSQEALYTSSNSSSSSSSSNHLPLFHSNWRPVMASWMYSVIDTFNLNPLCVPMGMYYLDTSCSTLPASCKGPDGKELYPLMAMTALNLAVKTTETRMFPLDQLVLLLGRGKKQQQSGQEHNMRYTPQDVIEMERTLLKTCQWKLHPTTAHDFLHQFVQVLDDESIRSNILEQAMIHLKNSILWEHVLHQQQHKQQQQQQQARSSYEPFLPSTLAYAAVLLAMEDMQLALVDKQATCLALLQVADMSTHTPHLSRSYNWLSYAKNLQAQLVAANQRQQSMPATPAPSADAAATRVVSPTTTATLSTGHAVPVAATTTTTATKADFQPPGAPPAASLTQAAVLPPVPPSCSSNALPVVSPAASTATTKTSVTMEEEEDVVGAAAAAPAATHGSMVVEETTVSIKAASAWQKKHFRHPSETGEENEHHDDCRLFQEEDDDEGEESDDLSEVIFYSHTFTGDGFEVMAIDTDSGDEDWKLGDDYVEDEDDYMDDGRDAEQTHAADPSLLASPSSTELSIADLILTESRDEDGFEVSYATGKNGRSELANMLASPTDVAA